ncbi:unnamed protein product [Meganyctiphanes norvegica]|uniref:Uncharacterized protein n=1 Tax=Meganyctiphanes norvegica TaxID=48144 RepID=A0AAV2R954_MEGNR
MVASFNEGSLGRSYVRVPGSGTDETAKPSLFDLSRVSMVVSPLPLQAGNGIIAANSAQNSKTQTENPSSSMKKLKRPREDDEEEDSFHKEKRQCVQNAKPSTDVINSECGYHESRKIYNVVKIEPTNELNQLLIQNHRLQQENIVLQKQVSLFRQLIKDPKRLKSVLNRLNIQNEI